MELERVKFSCVSHALTCQTISQESAALHPMPTSGIVNALARVVAGTRDLMSTNSASWQGYKRLLKTRCALTGL